MGSSHDGRGIHSRIRLVRLSQITQILDIPLRASDGRIGNAKDCKVILLCIYQEILQYLLMNGGSFLNTPFEISVSASVSYISHPSLMTDGSMVPVCTE